MSFPRSPPGGLATTDERTAALAFWAALPPPGLVTQLQTYRTETLPPQAGFPWNPLHSVHCMHCLNPTDCDFLISIATASAKATGWSMRRHAHFPTTDLETSSVPAIREWVVPRLSETFLPTMGRLFQVAVERLQVQEVFFVKYEAGGQPGLALHRDGEALSFSILLSHPSEFDGGGTQLESLGMTVRPDTRGDVFMHCGQMRHGGCEVTRGVRYLLVAFVDVVPSVRERLALHTERVQVLIAEGDTRDEAGDLPAAKTAYSQASLLAPDDIEAWTSLGHIEERLGDFHSAADCFHRAIFMAPADPDLWYYRAAALLAAGKILEAASCQASAAGLAEYGEHCDLTVLPLDDYAILHQYWEAMQL